MTCYDVKLKAYKCKADCFLGGFSWLKPDGIELIRAQIQERIDEAVEEWSDRFTEEEGKHQRLCAKYSKLKAEIERLKCHVKSHLRSMDQLQREKQAWRKEAKELKVKLEKKVTIAELQDEIAQLKAQQNIWHGMEEDKPKAGKKYGLLCRRTQKIEQWETRRTGSWSLEELHYADVWAYKSDLLKQADINE